MPTLDHNRVRDLFARAMESAGPLDRAAWVNAHAADADPAVRDAVRALLAAHDAASAGDFLQDPTITPTAGMFNGVTAAGRPQNRLAGLNRGGGDADDAVRAGDMVGPYQLVRELGRGGFGTVWRAEQQHPVRRPVAVKLINPGMDTRQVVARFRQERQALALMNHPNIARAIDAGTTAKGRPYFVMELVDGRPITDYCRSRRLSVAERLALFVQVCRAVQHAHQKGVVHRDLKPGNVLVAESDGRAVPKVIDFGVAKALYGGPADGGVAITAATELGQLVGTPQYMSPEQAVPGADADTRTDVYGLGVLLYELLSGRPPFDPDRLRAASMAELQRVLIEEEPPPPSRRARDRGPDVDESPDAHARLARRLEGDLDWIVLRAIEKDPARRYATADAVAEDVQRHLADEPVEAGPPGVGYRVGKFARRNRGLLTAGTVVVAFAAAGLVGTTVGLLRAEDARARAVEAQAGEAHHRQLAEAERHRALASEAGALVSAATAKANQERAEISERSTTGALAVARQAEARARESERLAQQAKATADEENRRLRAGQDFFLSILSPPGDVPAADLPSPATLAYLDARLDAGLLASVPEMEAPLRLGLALAYGRAGDNDRAEADYLRYAALHRKAAGRVPEYRLVTAYHNLAVIYAGRGDWPTAERHYRLALSAAARTPDLADRPLLAALTRRLLAEALLKQGKRAEAVQELSACVDLLRDAKEINEHEAAEGRTLVKLCRSLADQGVPAAEADRLASRAAAALDAQVARGVRPARAMPYNPVKSAGGTTMEPATRPTTAPAR